MTGFSSKLPIWYQIAHRLRSAILSGQPASGDKLEAETRLAEQYGVSVVPVRQALRALEEEGLIARRRGSGTFVCRVPPAFARGATSLKDLYSSAFTEPARILERGEVEIPQKFRSHFARDCASLHAIKRIAYRNDAPWMFGTLYILPFYATSISTADLERFPLYRLLEERHGVRLARSRFEAKAVAIGEEAAQYLEVAACEPALTLNCVSFDRHDRAVGAFDMTFPHEPFVFCFDTLHELGDADAD